MVCLVKKYFNYSLLVFVFSLGCDNDSSISPPVISPPVNNPPNVPALIDPQNNTEISSLSTNLIWSCSDKDGDDLKYTLYLGTTSDPSILKTNYAKSNYEINDLLYDTKYYWKIMAKDGQVTSSSITGVFKTHSAGLFFTGLYKSTTSLQYLKFYKDGYVIEVGTIGTPAEIAHWFTKNEDDVSIGKFIVGGSTLNFSVTDSYGTVDYVGTIGAGTVELTWYSHINGNSKKEIYNFIQTD